MSSGLGPINTAPSARPPASPATACEAETSDCRFAAALEDAQAPASAPRTASGAARARAGAAAKGAAPATPPPPDEPAAVDASAGDSRAEPAKLAGADTDAPQNQKAASEGPAGPDLSALLPGWPASPPSRACDTPALASTASQDSAARSGAAVDLVQGDRDDRGDRRERRERTELAQAGADLRTTVPAQATGARPAPPLPSTAAMAAEAASASTPRAGGDAPAALPLPALHASFMPATAASVASAATAAAAPTFEAHLAAALDSPVFAPALATQVSWLVREGVQHARLSLNPAEMGPVTVQIALDGTQARVDFSADIAATRAAIESSLPTLAAALHDRGLTLAGGGVFDGQPRPGTPGDRGQAAPNARRADGPADASAEASRGSRASGQAQRGLVDLVA